MEFGTFNLMGARDASTPAAQVFGEVPELVKRADELGYGIAWFAEHHFSNEYADFVTAFAAENVPVEKAHMTVNRFACITHSREEGMRFAENARYQARLAASLRHRQQVMQGISLKDVPFDGEPSLETIHDNLLIGDAETVAEKLLAEIAVAKPVHVCFSFKVGDTPHNTAMRSLELMIGEVKPRVEKALAAH